MPRSRMRFYDVVPRLSKLTLLRVFLINLLYSSVVVLNNYALNGEAASRLGRDCIINLVPYRARRLCLTHYRGVADSSAVPDYSSVSLLTPSPPPSLPSLALCPTLYDYRRAALNRLLPANITFPLNPFRGWWSSVLGYRVSRFSATCIYRIFKAV